MIRRPGIAGIRDKQLMHARYEEKKAELSKNAVADLHRQLETIKASLEEFASKYHSQIKDDPKFRTEFQTMCANIGVDPLASSNGYWSKILGIGDFYYHLGVRIIEICMANQKRNGGLMPVEDLIEQLNQTKSSQGTNVCRDDVERAIKKLRCLGNDFTIIRLSDSRHFVQSVPGELNMDHTKVLTLAESHGGHVEVSGIVKRLGWTDERAQTALDYLLLEGVAWIDEGDRGRSYWFPSLFSTSAQ